MSTVVKKQVAVKVDGKDITAPEGTVILDVAKRNNIPVTNLCSHRNLKPFAACRTCMVEVNVNGKKELVYSCTHPIEEGMEIRTNTEETNRYNGACLEMLLVEHPLDCPICDKSGVCPLQDNTEELGIFNNRFEINRRNEPSIKSNPLIEFYLNRCIMCGMCVRVCDEIQGVKALDFHNRGMKVGIGTANDEPLDCEFCGQCITVCPTGALMDMSSEARGLAALFTNNESTCNYCSWGCTVDVQTKKGKATRIEPIDDENVGINNGNLCAKGRFGHHIIHNQDRIQAPLMNVGGSFKEVTWDEAYTAIAERLKAAINRGGPETVAGIASEKSTNEENYLFQKLFRGVLGSNQITNLQHLRAPHVNRFMLGCFQNGMTSKPIQELEEADVVLIFNSDLPSEFPVAGNAIRKAAINFQTDIMIANPRNLVFEHESRNETRLTFQHGSDQAVANRLAKIVIDNKLVDLDKAKGGVSNFDDYVSSLKNCDADFAEKATGIDDETFTKAATRLARNADRFFLIGNDVLENEDGEDVLNALLNLGTLLHSGGEGSVNIYPPREHCNSQGVNDMGCAPEYLPGYKCAKDSKALSALAETWGVDALNFEGQDKATDLFENCNNGSINFLYIAGEDPIHAYYKGAQVQEALKTVPFLVVQDVFMTQTCQIADVVLPAASWAEKDGTYTNMSRHVQRVKRAVLPEGESKPDFDIFCELAEALGSPFQSESLEDVQQEIESVAPIYKGLLPGEECRQWAPEGSSEKPQFVVGGEFKKASSKKGYPLSLISNNHMFHIGSYTQHSKVLKTLATNCKAGMNPADANRLEVKTGDKVVVESKNHKLELPVEVTHVAARGTVHIPKNWPEIPVNMLRNGEEGLVSIKVSKAE